MSGCHILFDHSSLSKIQLFSTNEVRSVKFPPIFNSLGSTTIRSSRKCYKTSFRLDLRYVLKDPSYYLLKVKRRCGVTQKKAFAWFEIVGLAFRIFCQPFLHFKTKASSLLFLLEGCMHPSFFPIEWLSFSWCATLFLRIDLTDCAADRFL